MATARTQEVLTYQISGLVTTVSHPVRDGANRLMLVELMGRFASVTSVTYGGNAVDLVAGSDAGAGTAGTAHRHVRLARMIAPAVGTADLVVTITGNTGSATIRVRNLVDADQTTPLRAQGSDYALSASGTGSTGDTLNVTSVAGDLVLDLIASSASTLTIGAGQTLAGYGTAPNNRSSTEVATSASTAMSWTYSSATFAHCAVAIVGATATQPDPVDYSGTHGKKTWVAQSRITNPEALVASTFVTVPIGVDVESGAGTTDPDGRPLKAGTVSKFRVFFDANTCTTDTDFAVYDDGVITAITGTVAGGVTGWVDATGTHTFDGTTSGVLAYTAGTGGTISITRIALVYEHASTGAVTLLQTYSSASLQYPAATTGYVRPHGGRGYSTTEGEALVRVPFAATWDRMLVRRPLGNYIDAEVDAYSRINGADGNQTVHWPASSQDSAEDTTHSDTIADGDALAIKFVSQAGSGTHEVEWISGDLTAFGGEFLMICAAAPNSNGALATGVTYAPIGGQWGSTATRADAEMVAPFDIYAKRVFVDVVLNTGLQPCRLRLCINGVAGAQFVEIQPGIENVYYVDTWATDAIDEGDLVCLQFDNTSATNTIRIRSAGFVGIERAAVPALPTLSASTYKAGTLTSGGWTPQITAT